MSANSLRSTWDGYTSAWKAETTEAKRQALARNTLPDCIYRDPLMQTVGHDQLISYMLQFHQQIPGAYFDTDDFQAHHDRSIARWTMRDANHNALSEGISYGEYNSDGRLVSMTGFFETPAS